jgi:hypothetical protein
MIKEPVVVTCDRAVRLAHGTVTGTSTSRIALISPPRILAQPITSVSLCQPAKMARTVRLSTGFQPDVTPLAADPDIVCELEGVDSD